MCGLILYHTCGRWKLNSGKSVETTAQIADQTPLKIYIMGCGSSSEASPSGQTTKSQDKQSHQTAENQAAPQVGGPALPMLTGKPMPAVGLGTWQVRLVFL